MITTFEDKNHAFYKGDGAHESTKRERARKMYIIDKCESCDDKAMDIHHVDRDPGNNSRSNLLFLCRKCHMEIDGRLELLKKHTNPIKEPQACHNCKQLSKPLRKGLCHKCDEYYRRNNKQWEESIPGCSLLKVSKIPILRSMLSEGLSVRAMARSLCVSPTSVKNALKYVKG